MRSEFLVATSCFLTKRPTSTLRLTQIVVVDDDARPLLRRTLVERHFLPVDISLVQGAAGSVKPGAGPRCAPRGTETSKSTLRISTGPNTTEFGPLQENAVDDEAPPPGEPAAHRSNTLSFSRSNGLGAYRPEPPGLKGSSNSLQNDRSHSESR